MVWYVYEKATGAFAGSGVTQIENATHSSTEIEPPAEPDPPQLIFDANAQTWAWWMPVVQQVQA